MGKLWLASMIFGWIKIFILSDTYSFKSSNSKHCLVFYVSKSENLIYIYIQWPLSVFF